LDNAVAVVTGGGSGIGAAMCRRFVREGAKAVVVADLDGEAAEAVAGEIGSLAIQCDVTDEHAIQRLVDETVERFGAIDLFCSNAGGGGGGRGLDATDADWERSWRLNTMAHVYAARAVVPAMVERGSGYLLHTISAGGLVTGPAAATYTTTKHAALGFAEWLAIMYGNSGIKVSCLCPQAVDTPMVQRVSDPGTLEALRNIGSLLDPDRVADDVVAGLSDERFLILPNPEVGEYFLRKATDYDRWLRGMQRLMQRSDFKV
jgi:NAD(P)-dependent dehydrogenase (short-subunit alcohol dehydrogenase family)